MVALEPELFRTSPWQKQVRLAKTGNWPSIMTVLIYRNQSLLYCQISYVIVFLMLPSNSERLDESETNQTRQIPLCTFLYNECGISEQWIALSDKDRRRARNWSFLKHCAKAERKAYFSELPVTVVLCWLPARLKFSRRGRGHIRGLTANVCEKWNFLSNTTANLGCGRV